MITGAIRPIRITEMVMGIPVTIEAHASSSAPHQRAFRRLRAIDRRFSPYKPSSELCRMQRGELTADELSREMLSVIDACKAYEERTNGYFSAYYSGIFDPTGYVKGWAVEEAANMLRHFNLGTYSINAGGDILMASDNGRIWRTGIQFPGINAIIGTKVTANGAIATSGIYERGQHIINPHTSQASRSIMSASVCGASIVEADILATTCVAMGTKRALEFINCQAGYEALIVTANGNCYATPGFWNDFKTQSAQ